MKNQLLTLLFVLFAGIVGAVATLDKVNPIFIFAGFGAAYVGLAFFKLPISALLKLYFSFFMFNVLYE